MNWEMLGVGVAVVSVAGVGMVLLAKVMYAINRYFCKKRVPYEATLFRYVYPCGSFILNYF